MTLLNKPREAKPRSTLCLRLADHKDAYSLKVMFEGLVGFSKRGRIAEIRRAVRDKEIVVAQLAESGKSLVGFVHGIIHNDPISARPLLYITALYVKREYRRKGIGTSLLDHIISRSARSRSIEGVEIATARRAALHFYNRLGFKPFKEDFEEKLVQIDVEDWRKWSKLLRSRDVWA